MNRHLKDYLIISLKGIAMGAADTVPGVSGGTIAFITGIYEELITTIGKIDFSLIQTWRKEGFQKMWKELNGNFLISLMAGIAISIFTIMRLTRYLLENHPIYVWAFFFGLVLASIWFVGKQIKRWHAGTIIALVGSALIAYWITTFSASSQSESTYLFLFIAGAIAICAMILPGISGAYILVLIGAYEEIVHAVSEFELKKIIVTGLGMVVGLLSFSRILKWLFERHENLTLAALTGFIAGSLNKIWPWKKILESKEINGELQILSEKSVWPGQFEGDPKLVFAIVFFIFGFLLILALEAIANKSNQTNAKSNPHA